MKRERENALPATQTTSPMSERDSARTTRTTLTTRTSRSRLRLLTLAVTAASLLVAGVAYSREEAEQASAEPGESSCSAMVFTAAGSVSRGAIFKAMKVIDLEVGLVLPSPDKAAKTGLFKVRFLTPRGALYEERAVPYSDAKSGEKERRLPGYPFPVPVQQVTQAASGKSLLPSVKVKLPVGGTSIVGSGLYGTWGVTAERDGLPLCKGTFTLVR